MSDLDKDPVSSPLTLKIVGIFAVVSIALAIPLVLMYESKKEMERLAKTEAEEERNRAAVDAERKKLAAKEEAERKAAKESADREAAKRKSLQNVTMQTLVPLIGQENKGKIETTSDWADASIYAVRQGDVLVSVTDIRQAGELQIQLSVKNLGSKGDIAFKGWGRGEGNV